MLRYDRQTKSGLVALYDIRPGNGAGPFLQPRSPHGAPDSVVTKICMESFCSCSNSIHYKPDTVLIRCASNSNKARTATLDGHIYSHH